MLPCSVCCLPYVDSTTDTFCFIWINYMENNRKALRGEERMQPEHVEYFAADNLNCFLNDYGITLIDKADGSDSTQRE